MSVTPCWRVCVSCGDYWCEAHELHVYDCPCPPAEEWNVWPYLEMQMTPQEIEEAAEAEAERAEQGLGMDYGDVESIPLARARGG